MAQVEHLLRASMVQVARVGPRAPAARFCLTAYFAELAERFEAGFDRDLANQPYYVVRA